MRLLLKPETCVNPQGTSKSLLHERTLNVNVESLWLWSRMTRWTQATLMRKLRGRYSFGTYRILQCDEGGTFIGRWTEIEKHFSVRGNTSAQIRQKFLDVYISPKGKRALQDVLSEAERRFFKIRTVAVMWCALECCNEAFVTAAKEHVAWRAEGGVVREGRDEM